MIISDGKLADFTGSHVVVNVPFCKRYVAESPKHNRIVFFSWPKARRAYVVAIRPSSVRKQFLVNTIQSSESSVPFENQPDPPMHDRIMALEMVKIAIKELVNTIQSLFCIVSQPNLYSS